MTTPAVQQLLDATTPDTRDLIEEITAFLRRYVFLTEAQAYAVALYVLHTHVLDASDYTPFLAVTSPAKRCGKSRLLSVLSLLVARPWQAITPSEAVLYRKITRDQPTLLLDETDAIFTRNGDTEGLRALLNAGNQRGTRVPRCVGQSNELVEFDVFCPKVLAGIGRLPDTVADRAIPIRLQRKAPQERVERFYRREVEPVAAELHVRIEAWAPAHVEALREARPDLPDALDDRAADGWEPLLAIADLAGPDEGERARRIAVELSTGDDREDDSVGAQLLAHIREVFDGERMTCSSLVAALNADDEMPYGGWAGGHGITTRDLGQKLKPYRIKANTIRDGETKGNGYHRAQFEDAWNRYVPPLDSGYRDNRDNPHRYAETGPPENRDTEGVVPVPENSSNPHEQTVVPLVPVSGGEDGNGAPRPDEPLPFEDGGAWDVSSGEKVPLSDLDDARGYTETQPSEGLAYARAASEGTHAPYLIDENGRCERHPDKPDPACLECQEVERRKGAA